MRARPPRHRFSQETNERRLTYVRTAKKREPFVRFSGEPTARHSAYCLNSPLVFLLKNNVACSKNVKQLQLKSLKLFFQACSISNNMKKISVFNFFYLHNTGLEAVILFILMDMGLFFRD